MLPADIKLSANNNKLRSGPHTYSYIGNVPFIDLADKPIAEWDHVWKWIFDKVMATIAVILLVPAEAPGLQ